MVVQSGRRVYRKTEVVYLYHKPPKLTIIKPHMAEFTIQLNLTDARSLNPNKFASLVYSKL